MTTKQKVKDLEKSLKLTDGLVEALNRAYNRLDEELKELTVYPRSISALFDSGLAHAIFGYKYSPEPKPLTVKDHLEAIEEYLGINVRRIQKDEIKAVKDKKKKTVGYKPKRVVAKIR